MNSSPATSGDLRRRYSDEALRQMPRLLLMVDRNQYSRTYGSFDRSYWHYRTMDFPCGMSQEFCYPLALAYAHDFPDNEYYRSARMRELALAGIDCARRSAHRDASCDDYFPYERALGAVVFSLNAFAETLLTLNEKPPELVEFIARRADFLSRYRETGQLANHQALAALALYNTFLVTGEERFRCASTRFLEIVSSWQTPEGWFWEYEGADPGYHTCTIAFLARLFRKTGDERLIQMLQPAVDFAWHFMGPDGSYAGEYGSRNTYHFYAYGFEVMAPHSRKAAQVADQFLTRALSGRSRYFNDDDRMCAHYVYDWMQAYLDFSAVRPAEPMNARGEMRRYFEQARIYVDISPVRHAVLSLAKGGVIKVTNETGPVYSDTGLIGETERGEVIVSHMVDDYDVRADVEAGVFSAAGRMCRRKQKLATPFTQILFRLLNMTLGRLAPNLLRSTLQKVLITGKPRTDYRFRREFRFTPDAIIIESEMEMPQGVARLKRLSIGSDATSIYVANSNVYQRSVLLPWQELDPAKAKQTITIKPATDEHR